MEIISLLFCKCIAVSPAIKCKAAINMEAPVAMSEALTKSYTRMTPLHPHSNPMVYIRFSPTDVVC